MNEAIWKISISPFSSIRKARHRPRQSSWMDKCQETKLIQACPNSSMSFILQYQRHHGTSTKQGQEEDHQRGDATPDLCNFDILSIIRLA